MNELARAPMAACLLGVVLGSGCNPDLESCRSISAGDYALEVVEKWNQDSSFMRKNIVELSKYPRCLLEDIQPGTHDFRIGKGMEFTARGCYDPECPSDFPSSGEALPDAPYRQGEWLCIHPDVTTTAEPCELHRMVGLERINTAKAPTAEPVAGELPPVVLIRTLAYFPAQAESACADPSTIFPDGAEMSGTNGSYFRCADAWVVKLTAR